MPTACGKLPNRSPRLGQTTILLVARREDRLAWLIGAPAAGGEYDELFPRLKDLLLPIIDGKGGGRAPFWQGSGTRTDKADAMLTAFSRAVTESDPKSTDS